MAKQKIIKADVLFDGKGKAENKYIVVEGNKIVDVTAKKTQSRSYRLGHPCFH